ncbi:MAG: transglutaminase domain-containing protein [Paracoccaceae bacterium]
MRLKITHETCYSFDHPVNYGLQQLRLVPKSTRQQTVLNWETSVEGGKSELSFEDYHGNTVNLISFEKDVTDLVIKCAGMVEISEGTGVVGPHHGPVPLWLFERPTSRTKPGQGVRGLLREVEGDTPLDRLHSAMSVIGAAVTYEVDASYPDWTAETAIAEGRGVCQDHAHVFIALVREMGLPARYVSGYLMLNDRVDQAAMHAWAEAHVPDLGWVGFDVSNGICPDQRYVRVATGLDYADAAPVNGSRLGGTGEALRVQIEVAEQ